MNENIKFFKVPILVTVVVLGILLLFLQFSLKNDFSSRNRRILSTLDDADMPEPNDEPQYEFTDPAAAYFILKKLGFAQSFNGTNSKLYDDYYLGLKTNHRYCEEQMSSFIQGSKVYFEETTFVTDYPKYSMLRKDILPTLGVDLHPELDPEMNDTIRKSHRYDFSHDAMIFFNNFIYRHRHVGTQFSCQTQMSNHIPGHDYLYRKDFAAQSLLAYERKYLLTPQCFSYEKFFPRTWVLYVEDHCKEFFEQLNSPQYEELKKERGIVYIRKLGDTHSEEDLQPVNQREEKYLRKIYNNGELCGKIEKNFVIQQFIHNPLLLDEHKFDFRAFMLIASTNPMMVYYHDGLLRVSLQHYDAESTDKSVIMTNSVLSKELFKQAKATGSYHGMNEKELRNFQTGLFSELQNHLLERGIVTDPNWLENYLRPEIKKAMVHLIRMSQNPLLKSSSVYELQGVDFMLDKDLNLWFLEANIRPSIVGGVKKRVEFMTKMVKDHFEIVNGLLRSRLKRVIGYVNMLVKEGNAQMTFFDDMDIDNLEMRRREFRQVLRNKFESEFEPSQNNGFSLIIDENKKGIERYSGLLSEECI